MLFTIACSGLFNAFQSKAQDIWHQASGPYGSFNLNSITKGPNGTLFAGGFADYAGGVVYRSTDDGNTWAMTGPSPMQSTVYPTVVDAFGTVYVGTDGQGIWRSTDNGSSWLQIGSGLPSLSSFSIASSTGGNLYTASSGTLFFSSDKGNTWNSFGSSTTPKPANEVYVSPAGYIFIVVYPTVYRSTDNGNSWTNLSLTGLTNGGIASINSFASASNGNLYFSSWGGGVFVSTNAGATWSNPNVNLPRLYMYSIAVAQNGNVLAGSDSGRVYLSTDNGTSWSIIGQTIGPHFATWIVSALTVNGQDEYVAGCRGAYIYSTTSQLWRQTGFPASVIRAAAFNSSGAILATGSYTGIQISTDAGATWSFASGVSQNTYGQALLTYPDGTEFASTLSADGGTSGISRSTDGGSSWSIVSATSAYALSLTTQGSILGAIENWVLRSTDDGTNWIQTLPIGITASSFCDDGLGNMLLGGGQNPGGLIMKSSDDGITWKALDTLKVLIQTVDALTHVHDSLIVGATDRALYESLDHGLTWKELTSFQQYWCKQLVVTRQSFIVAGTDTSGVYISFDRGATWNAYNNGLKNRQITSLAISSNDLLVAGTNGSGIFYMPIPSVPFVSYFNVSLSQSLTDLNLGSSAIDDSISALFVIKNTGTAALTVNNLSAQDSTFTVNPKTFSLTAGNSQFVMVTFKPRTVGQYTESLFVSSNFPGMVAPLILTGEGGVSLPVELTSLHVSVEQNSVRLIWHTETEYQNYGFEIERMQVAAAISEWTQVTFVQGAGTRSSPRDYSYKDDNLTPGHYAYRLKQIDKDGSFKYYGNAEADILAPTQYSIQQNFPNPFNPSTTIRYALPIRSSVRLLITNSLGQQVEVLESGEQEAGFHEVEWRANVASGIYFYRIESVSTADPNKRFIQVKKMLLLK